MITQVQSQYRDTMTAYNAAYRACLKADTAPNQQLKAETAQACQAAWNATMRAPESTEPKVVSKR